MKITKNKLKALIKEELNILEQAGTVGQPGHAPDPGGERARAELRARGGGAQGMQKVLRLLKQAEGLLLQGSGRGSGTSRPALHVEWAALSNLRKAIKGIARNIYSDKQVAARTPEQQRTAQALEKGEAAAKAKAEEEEEWGPEGWRADNES